MVEEVLGVAGVGMKTLVLMVAISATGEDYEYMPMALVETETCYELAGEITNDKTFYQHAYCTDYTIAPYKSPRPRGRP